MIAWFLGALALLCAAVFAFSLNATRTKRLAAAVYLIAVSGGLYWWLGSPLIVDAMSAYRTVRAPLEQRIAELETAPKNAQNWADLGQAYMEAGGYAASAAAYKQSVVLSGGDAGAILQYAKAMIFAADGTVTAEAAKAIDMVLMQDKTNQEARYFNALWLLQEGKAADAMRTMKALYKELPEHSVLKLLIDKQIGRDQP